MMSIANQTNFNISSSLATSHPSKSNLKPTPNSLLNFTKSSTFNPLRCPARKSQIKASAVSAEPISYVNPQTLYELLGISETVTLSEIKNAYRQLARKYHPDVSPSDRTEEYTKRFLEVQEAYETLSDPESRASYDRDLARGLGVYSLFSGKNRSRSQNPGFVCRDEWESQLEELIRSSNNGGNRQSWGARMRSKSCSVN